MAMAYAMWPFKLRYFCSSCLGQKHVKYIHPLWEAYHTEHKTPYSHNTSTDGTDNSSRAQLASKLFIYFAGVYLFAWTPYTVVSIKMAFFGISKTTNMEFKLLAFFAKTSFIFNPLVYIGFHPPYRWEYVQFLIQTFVTIADKRAH